jgi:hypothetical protein
MRARAARHEKQDECYVETREVLMISPGRHAVGFPPHPHPPTCREDGVKRRGLGGERDDDNKGMIFRESIHLER